MPLLNKAIELRREIAGILGYDTWYVVVALMRALRCQFLARADYITEVKMIKSGKGIKDVSYFYHFF